ncbi:hypothetical protein H1C71_040406, partial [Ictidomys tridecemlineatus]
MNVLNQTWMVRRSNSTKPVILVWFLKMTEVYAFGKKKKIKSDQANERSGVLLTEALGDTRTLGLVSTSTLEAPFPSDVYGVTECPLPSPQVTSLLPPGSERARCRLQLKTFYFSTVWKSLSKEM